MSERLVRRHRLNLAVAFLSGLVLWMTVGCQAPDVASSPVAPATPEAALAPPPKPRVLTYDRRGVDLMARLLQGGGRTAEVTQIEAALRDLERSGMPYEEALAAVARRYGVWPHSQYGTTAVLIDRLDVGVPVLVQLQDTEDSKTRYFALIEKYGSTVPTYLARLDDGTLIKFTEAELWRRWNRRRFWMMTACPPERGSWELSALEHISRMQFYDAAGQFEVADADAAKALLLDGRNPDLCVALAVRERMRGRLEAAEELLRRVLARQPDYVRAMNNLAYLLTEQGRNPEEAEKLARAAVLREPTNPRVLDTLAFVLQSQQRRAEALPLYERAHQRALHMPPAARREIGFHLIRAYLQQERRDEAGLILQELLREDPGLLVPPDLENLAR